MIIVNVSASFPQILWMSKIDFINLYEFSIAFKLFLIYLKGREKQRSSIHWFNLLEPNPDLPHAWQRLNSVDLTLCFWDVRKHVAGSDPSL